MKPFKTLYPLALAAALAASTACASPIIYHFAGIASGTLDNNTLSQVQIDVIVQSDTTAVSGYSHGWVNAQAPGVAQITVAGFGSGVFTDHTSLFDATNSPGVIGFTAVSGSLGFNDIIQIYGGTIGSTFFSTYDLRSATDVYGHFANPSISDWVNVGTSLGVLTLNSMQDTTFQATLIPEPATVGVLGLGLLALLQRRRR